MTGITKALNSSMRPSTTRPYRPTKKAIDIDPQDELGWNLKAKLLKKLGRTTEANAVYATLKELDSARTITVLDHSMANSVDESTKSAINRTQEFSVNDSKAYSWLSLRNVQGDSTLWWYWSSYNVWAPLDIPNLVTRFKWGEADAEDARRRAEEANLLPTKTNKVPDPYGDWIVDVYVNDQWLLQEQFTVVSG